MSELPLGTLRQIIWGDQEKLDKVDLDEQPNPMEGFILRNQVQAALGKSDGRMSVTLDLSVPATDIDDDSAELYKAPIIQIFEPGPNTLAKRLGIAKTTTRTDESGTRWIEGFDAAGNLVDTRVLLYERT